MTQLWFFVLAGGGVGLLVGVIAGALFVRTLHDRQGRKSSLTSLGVPALQPAAGNEPTESVQQADTQTQDRLREIAHMTGGLAHEIKNPLSTIGLNTRLLGELLSELDLPPEQASRLTRRADALRREIERLEGILTDFLEYAGEPRLDAFPTDLNELVRDVTDFFLPQAQQRGIRLHVQLAPDQLVADVDGAQLKQAILNLMLNAVQAIESQPQQDEHSRQRELIVRTARESDGIAIHVTDTGPGMDASALERIFHPYYTTKAGGSGLGLPITRKLVEAMGGKLALHSEPGRGTDVRMRFPPHTPEPR
jgi:signal transduction histidine kinase